MTNTATINCVGFNQTGSCLAIGTSQGYGLYNCSPFGKFHSELMQEGDDNSDIAGGYSLVSMLYSTSLVALVGNGASPQLSPRTLRLVNTRRGTVVCEVSFPTPVLSAQLTRTRLAVLLSQQLYVYDLPTLALLRVVDRAPTHCQQVCASGSGSGNGRSLLVYASPAQRIPSEVRPGLTTNSVGVAEGASDTNEGSDSEPEENGGARNFPSARTKHGDVVVYDLEALEPVLVIEAHENAIAALALSSDGALLATASARGTIVRVFSTATGLKLFQFRRGTYRAQIQSMAFSGDGAYLCVCASRQTVHVFKLGEGDAVAQPPTPLAGETPQTLYPNGGAGTDAPAQPYVDAARATVGRLIRNSSQSLTRRAAETLGQIFPRGVSALLDPARHFASIKLPGAPGPPGEEPEGPGASGENDTGVWAAAAVGGTLQIRRSDYPELFPQEGEGEAVPEGDTRPMVEVRVATTQGQLYRYVMDPERGGDCVLLAQYPLL